MRVNVYDEEISKRVEILKKTKRGKEYTGVRLYLELPVTETTIPEVVQRKGPFIGEGGDDCTAAVTFWTTGDPRELLRTMLSEVERQLP